MTTPQEGTRLLEFLEEGVVISVKNVDALIEENGMVALRATILDPENLEASGTELLVQMLPADAYKFAATIHATAKDKAWSFPNDAKFVRWQQSTAQRPE